MKRALLILSCALLLGMAWSSALATWFEVNFR
jgi:hypothetical protein